MACACLHNFAISKGDMWLEKGKVNVCDTHDPADDYIYSTELDFANLTSGHRVRDDLTNKFYS